MVSGAVRESNPRPLAPEARIIPLDQRPSGRARAEAVPSLPTPGRGPVAVGYDTSRTAPRVGLWSSGMILL